MREEISDCTALPYEVSPEGDTIRAALRARIRAHSEERDNIAAKLAELREVPPTGWSASHEKMAAKLRDRQRESVVNEIAIRNALAEWFAHVDSTEQPAAYDGAHGEYARLQEDVRQRLLTIGYEELFNGRDALSDKVAAHPAVRAARCNTLMIQGSDVGDRRRVNEAALKECLIALEAHKRQAVGALSA